MSDLAIITKGTAMITRSVTKSIINDFMFSSSIDDNTRVETVVKALKVDELDESEKLYGHLSLLKMESA